MIRFGPAGNDDTFKERGGKSSTGAPAFIASLGIDAYEYQCGRGVNISDETAAELGRRAREAGVALSLHAPYYISMSSPEPEKQEGSIGYILRSCRAAKAMGATRVVIHTGAAGKMTRDEAMKNASALFARVLKAKEEAGFAEVSLCPETMGKINQLGDLSEVARLCAEMEELIPCVDFGHLNARTHGGYVGEGDFEALFDELEAAIGRERTSRFHGHFSRIEFSAGGEVRHLTYEDGRFGPDFAPLARVLARRNYEPVIICESAGTQARDSVVFKQLYAQAAAARDK